MSFFEISSGCKIRLLSCGSNKYLRILNSNKEVDGKGSKRGQFTVFVVHKISPSCIKLQSNKLGSFVRITSAGKLDGKGKGGKWCNFKLHIHESKEISLESNAFSSLHVGILQNGETKPPKNTRKGRFGRFKVEVVRKKKKDPIKEPTRRIVQHKEPKKKVIKRDNNYINNEENFEAFNVVFELSTSLAVDVIKSSINALEKIKIEKPFMKRANGRLRQISVGSESQLIGTNSSNFVHKRGRRLLSQTWFKQPGSKFKEVSIGSDGELWGVTTKKEIFRWTNNCWKLVQGDKMRNISVGSKFHIWGVSESNKIYKYQGDAWIKIIGSLYQVSCNNKGDVFGVDSIKRVWAWNGVIWNQMEGTCDWVEVDNEGILRGYYKGRCLQFENNQWFDITSMFPKNTIHFSFSSSKVGAAITNGDYIWLSQSIKITNLNEKPQTAEKLNNEPSKIPSFEIQKNDNSGAINEEKSTKLIEIQKQDLFGNKAKNIGKETCNKKNFFNDGHIQLTFLKKNAKPKRARRRKKVDISNELNKI